MRALITGVCGFSGAHLAAHLLSVRDVVVGLDVPEASPGRLRSLGADIEVLGVDLRDAPAVASAIVDRRPEVIYHLAGLAGTDGLEAMLVANVVCTKNLLDAALAVAAAGPAPRVLLVSSAAVYGHVPLEEQPIVEDRVLRPTGAYGISKASMEFLGWAYVESTGLEVVVVRPFNLSGAGSPVERLPGEVQRQLEEIQGGARAPRLELGDLSASRDYIDVAEAVRAYRVAAVRGAPGTAYNVCSGTPTPARRLVQEMVAASGLEGVEISEGHSARTPGVDVAYGDPSLLRALERE